MHFAQYYCGRRLAPGDSSKRCVKAVSYIALMAASLGAMKGTLLLTLPVAFSSSPFRLVIVADLG